MRPIGTRNADPVVAQLEDELFELLNETGIGPMGLGGDVTVLQCHIEHADTHMTLNPVAVNYQCWAARRASAHIGADGSDRLRPGVLMATHEVTFPITDEREILKLRAGDEVVVQGHIIGIRDRTQIRIFDQGAGAADGPARRVPAAHGARACARSARAATRRSASARRRARAWCASPSRSAQQYGVRAICGKGGFPDEAIEPMQRLGMVYFAIVGGAAALETTQIEEIEEVAWEELMPECLWKFRVKDFGPLTVGIDAHGNSLYHDVQAARRRSWRSSLLDFDASTAASPRGAHPRDRQGPRPARVGGRARDGGRLHRHRQARLGHGLRHAEPRGEARGPAATKPVVIGGTFFEVVYARARSTSTSRGSRDLGLTHVEISDGTVEIPRERKLELIAEFARDFTVLSEVGSKDSDVVFAPYEWVAGCARSSTPARGR